MTLDSAYGRLDPWQFLGFLLFVGLLLPLALFALLYFVISLGPDIPNEILKATLEEAPEG